MLVKRELGLLEVLAHAFPVLREHTRLLLDCRRIVACRVLPARILELQRHLAATVLPGRIRLCLERHRQVCVPTAPLVHTHRSRERRHLVNATVALLVHTLAVSVHLLGPLACRVLLARILGLPHHLAPTALPERIRLCLERHH